MLCKVEIWGKELICEICSHDYWFRNTLKTEFMKEENAFEYSQQVRYLFECKTCGNCKMFGMVSNENDMDDVNIRIIVE